MTLIELKCGGAVAVTYDSVRGVVLLTRNVPQGVYQHRRLSKKEARKLGRALLKVGREK